MTPRPNRRPPLAAPEEVARQEHRRHRRPPAIPAEGGQGFWQRRSFRLPRRWLLLALGGLWMLLGIMGWHQPVVLITPYEIRGTLGPGGDTPRSAAERTVTYMRDLQRELASPGYELRIGAPALDQSLPSQEEMRWLHCYPAAPVQYHVAWWWCPPRPSESQAMVQLALARVGWTLAGRRTFVVTGSIFAADTRMMVQTQLNSRTLQDEQLYTQDWSFALRPIADALLMEFDPAQAAMRQLRSYRMDGAREAARRLAQRRQQEQRLLAGAITEYVSALESGAWWRPWDPLEPLLQHSRAGGAASTWMLTAGAELALRSGHGAQATEWLETAVKRNRRSPGPRLLLAYVLMRRTQLRDALDEVTRVRRDVPEGQLALVWLLEAEILRRLHVPQTLVMEPNNRAFAQAPDDPLLLNNRAVWRYYRGQHERAAENLRQAQSPGFFQLSAVVENSAVLAFEREGLIEGPLRQLQRARNRSGGILASPWQHAARLYFETGQYAEAAALLQEAASRLPAHGDLALQAAYAQAAAGDIAGALAAVEQLDRNASVHGRRELYLGHIHMFAGDFDLAERWYFPLLHDYSSPRILGRAHALFLLGKYEEAAAEFAEYQQRHPFHLQSRLFWAWCQPAPLSEETRTTLRMAQAMDERPVSQALIALVIGAGEPAAVLQALEQSGVPSWEWRGLSCLTQFHIGQWYRTRGEFAAARRAYTACVDHGLPHYYEHIAAREFLRQMDLAGE